MITKPKTLLLLAVLIAPGFALAAGPAPQPQDLGTVEAILALCARLLPPAADQFQQASKTLTQGAGAETVESLRASKAYRSAREATVDALARVSDQVARNACKQYLAGK